MMFNLGKYIPLTEEEFKAEVAARQAKAAQADRPTSTGACGICHGRA